MKQRKKDCVRSSKNIDEKEKEKNTGNRRALRVTHNEINIGLLPSELSGSSKSLRGVLMAN